MLGQPEMGPVAVVVADIFVHEPFQVPLVHDNHVIKQVTAAGADEALRDPVLPRTLEGGSLWLDPEAFDSVDDAAVEVRGPIKDEIFWRGVIGKRLTLAE